MATSLQFIESIDANTGVSSVAIDNVFNKGYDVYFVTVTDLNIDGNRSPFMRLLDSSGSEITSSVYDRASLAMFTGGSFGEYKNVDSTEWLYIPSLYINDGLLDNFANFYVYNAEDTNSYTFLTAQGGDNVTGGLGMKTIAVCKQTALHRGFSFKYASGTSNNFTSGKISVYGVK
tara:strand:+ start:58 stop:582 length:525 start_codon:yes stop_codon:yes gene_type:complete